MTKKSINNDPDNFQFGLEGEFMLVSETAPLWIHDMTFEHLLDIVDAIDTSDLRMDGLNKKPLHHHRNHYLIEGYTLTDACMQPEKLLPKGIEARTPTTATIEEAIATLDDLHTRLRTALDAQGLDTAIIGHHPVYCDFDSPRNYHRDDYWQWARTATATYGPDINISLPSMLDRQIDTGALALKSNYYMPAAAALSFASPFFEGTLWQPAIAGGEGRATGSDIISGVGFVSDADVDFDSSIQGRSVRAFRRCLWAPAHYVHNDDQDRPRYEFKAFEMAQDLRDYHAYFLIGLAILLDGTLKGEATPVEHVTRMRHTAIYGLTDRLIRDTAAELIDSADRTAKKYGFANTGLDEMQRRIDTQTTPADTMIAQYNRCSNDLMLFLASRKGFTGLQGAESFDATALTTVE